MNSMGKIFSRLVQIVLLFIFVSSVFGQSITKIVVFGDSLSDNGNLYEYMKRQLPLSPPYFKGRFSNGYVWAELLAKRIFATDWSMHFLDYAFGGAGVLGPDGDFDDDTLFSLNHEIDSYLLAHQEKVSSDALFVVWIGANNYLAMPEDQDAAVSDVNWGIRTSLQRLVDHGAQYILVMNLPDLGQTPMSREFDTQTELNAYSEAHNVLLEKNIRQLKIENPKIKWLFFNTNELFQQAMKNPQQFGFTNMVNTCYESMLDHDVSHGILNMVSHVRPEMKQLDSCDGYFFFDLVHPTALAHQIISDKVYEMLKNENIV